jgi:(4S)-4-hydroxy-5-phosphonooxypentane-2,3-dione isomerase
MMCSSLPVEYRKGGFMSFVLAVNIRIKPDNVDVWMKKAAENAREARKEPGCRQFDVLVDPNDRTRVMLYEVYDDEKAFEAHQQTPHFKKYLAEAVPLLASRERQVWKRA